MLKQVVALAITSSLIGCASQTGWTPTVDSYNSPNAYRLQQDMNECKELAKQASGGTATESAKGALAGGLIGGAAGAALGAIAGSPGTGAAIGAAAAGVGGAAYTGVDAENQYKRSYENCLRNRGHKVIN